MSERVFEVCTTLPVSASRAFAWHDRPGAFQRLNAPWEPVEVLEQTGGIRDGAQVVVRMPAGPGSVRLHVEHVNYEAGRRFEDVQRSGPFRSWRHVHSFEPHGDEACVLRETITYALPVQALAGVLGANRFVERKLRRLFTYRFRVTEGDLIAHDRHRDRARLTVAISGAGGLIGAALSSFLSTGGHSVRRLVRRPVAAPDEIEWQVDKGIVDPATLDGVDAIVHLAGEGVASGRWTASRRARIRSSRVDGTRSLCTSIATASSRPRTMVVASAVGIYGDRGDETITETSAHGQGFLADVAAEWEAAADPAREAGLRVVHPRIGMVVTPAGGALSKLLIPARLGASAQVGRGDQYVSWIGLDDAITAIAESLVDERYVGPMNLTAPSPVTNRAFAKILARVLRRPAIGRLPAAVARIGLGAMADELILAGARVLPKTLEQNGYVFRDTDLETALRHGLGRWGNRATS